MPDILFSQTFYSTCHQFNFMEGELCKKSILCDGQLLTMHSHSSKGPTQILIQVIVLGRLVLLTEVKIVGSTNHVMHLSMLSLREPQAYVGHLTFQKNFWSKFPLWGPILGQIRSKQVFTSI